MSLDVRQKVLKVVRYRLTITCAPRCSLTLPLVCRSGESLTTGEVTIVVLYFSTFLCIVQISIVLVKEIIEKSKKERQVAVETCTYKRQFGN